MTLLRQNLQTDSHRKAPDPLFLDGTAGRLYALHYSGSPSQPTHLIIPPFGEEMNRCRAFMNDLARAYQRSGHGALIIDLYGTGESDGEFKDATWDIWLSDIEAALNYLRSADSTSVQITAIRLGALLALKSDVDPSSISLIAPEINGERFIHQLIRARIIAETFISSQYGGQPSNRNTIDEELAQQGYVNLLGYELNSGLIENIQSLKFSADDISPCRSLHLEGLPPVWAQVEPENTAELAVKLVEQEIQA